MSISVNLSMADVDGTSEDSSVVSITIGFFMLYVSSLVKQQKGFDKFLNYTKSF